MLDVSETLIEHLFMHQVLRVKWITPSSWISVMMMSKEAVRKRKKVGELVLPIRYEMSLN